MKHGLFSSPALPVISGALALTLRLVESVGADGKPLLADCADKVVLAPAAFPQNAAGSFAVCLATDTKTLLVLGHLPASEIADALAFQPAHDERPLTLKCGRSELVLHPDGRVRITGDDVVVQSNGLMGLRGAIVELN